ncbi:MAG: hypothetical protein LBP36_04005 [Oscillospiraceae bacterium]|nr:hypothetical protein [Oscillospiraceae bacterium]
MMVLIKRSRSFIALLFGIFAINQNITAFKESASFYNESIKNIENKQEKGKQKNLNFVNLALLGLCAAGIPIVTYEALLNYNYLRNKAKLDVDELEVKNLSASEKLRKFWELSKILTN